MTKKVHVFRSPYLTLTEEQAAPAAKKSVGNIKTSIQDKRPKGEESEEEKGYVLRLPTLSLVHGGLATQAHRGDESDKVHELDYHGCPG